MLFSLLPSHAAQAVIFHRCFCHRRILLQEVGELFADNRVNSASRLAVAELLLGLSLELRLLDLDADDRREPLSDIVSGERRLCIL